MNDEELKALRELVAADIFCMDADNEIRKQQGYSLAYDGNVEWEARDKLEAELKRRGILN